MLRVRFVYLICVPKIVSHTRANIPCQSVHSDVAVDGRLLVGSIRKARQINGNLDWRCGSCTKVNFARNVVCINCGKSVDKYTEYLDGSEKQVCASERVWLCCLIHVAHYKLGETCHSHMKVVFFLLCSTTGQKVQDDDATCRQHVLKVTRTNPMHAVLPPIHAHMCAIRPGLGKR